MVHTRQAHARGQASAPRLAGIEKGMRVQVSYQDGAGDVWHDCTVDYIDTDRKFFKTKALSDGNEQKFSFFPHPEVRLPASDGSPFRGGGGVRISANTNDIGVGARSAGGAISSSGASAVGTGQKRPSSEECNCDGGRSKRASGGDGGRGGRPGPSGGSADSQELGVEVSIGVDVGNSGTASGYSIDHESITIMPLGTGREGQNKSDTCLLLKFASDVKPYVEIKGWCPEEWRFEAFGEDADVKAHELEPFEENQFMFFNDFKMELYRFEWGRAGERGDREPKVKPNIGIQLEVPVRYIYKTIFEQVKEEFLGAQGRLTRGIEAGISFVSWQVTHPANFQEEAKKLMRLAAEDAGIKRSRTGNLTKMIAEVTDGVSFKSRFELLSEPEAAVLQATHDNPNNIVIGTRVMVVDIGGGTTDITLHEIAPLKPNTRKSSGAKRPYVFEEIHASESLPEGSRCFDKDFEERVFIPLFGQITPKTKREVMKSWKQQVKDKFGGDHCTCEVQVGSAICELQQTKNFAPAEMCAAVMAHIQADAFLRGRVHLEISRLKLRPELIKDLFEKTLEKIIDKVVSILEELKRKDRYHDSVPDFIFVVGGGSENKHVEKRLKEAIEKTLNDPEITPVIIFPVDRVLAVLRGAVHFGHNDKDRFRFSRKASVTLGYNLWEPFEEQKHGPWDELPRNRTHKDPAGGLWVGPRFQKVVEAGQSLSKGLTSRSLTIASIESGPLEIIIYESKTPDVEWTDDNYDGRLRKLGSVEVLADFRDKLHVEFTFDRGESQESAEGLLVLVRNLTKKTKEAKNLTYSFEEHFERLDVNDSSNPA